MEAGSPLRTPRAAAIAGVLFALLIAMTLFLLRLTAPTGLVDVRSLAADRKIALALGLVPFAGIAFLWLIGVVRDRVGAREDRFLASVSLGSGILFVGLLFTATAIATGTLATAASAPSGASPETFALGRRIAVILMNTYAMRMAAVFMVSTSTIGLRTAFVPRWIGVFGYAIALLLLLGLRVTLWVQLLFPLWVFVLSLHILVMSFREQTTPRTEKQPGEGLDEHDRRKSA